MSNSRKKKIFTIIISIVILLIVATLIWLFVSKKKKAVKEEPTIVPILKEIRQNEPSENPLKREHNWGDSKETIIEKEKVTYSEYLNDQSHYVTYNYTEVFDEEMLLTYMFNSDKLIGVLYERVLNDLDRKNIAIDHQFFTSEITSMLNKDFKKTLDWSTFYKKIYDNNLWSDSLIKGDLEASIMWDNAGLDEVYLFTSAFPMFDFLFVETEEFGLGNQSILVVDSEYVKNNGIAKVFEIRPSLTREQVKLKEDVDLFANSINEDALTTGVARKSQGDTIKIVQFDKVKEAILLVNTTNDAIDLTDYTIEAQSGEKFIFDEGFNLKANERIVVYGKNGKDRYSEGVSRLIEWSDEEIFDDKKEVVTIFDSEGKTISSSR